MSRSAPLRFAFVVVVMLLASLFPPTELVSAGVGSVLVQTPNAAADTKATIILKFLRPTDFVRSMTGQPFYDKRDKKLNPKPLENEGLQRLTPHELDDAIDIEGTPDAIAEVKFLVEIMDREPREAFVTLSITRVHLYTDGVRERRSVGKARVSTFNNASAVVDVASKYRVSVTPHVNGDDSVSLAVNCVFPEGSKQDGVPFQETYVRIANGEKRRFRFVAAAARPQTRAVFSRKGIAIDTDNDRSFETMFKGQAAVVYYVDVTVNAPPTVGPPTAAPPQN